VFSIYFEYIKKGNYDDIFLELEEKESQEEDDAVYSIKPMGFASCLHRVVVVCSTIYRHLNHLQKDESGDSKLSDGVFVLQALSVWICLILSIK